MRIGILGGTFDPIHLGHLYLAEKIYTKLSLDKIIFIPVYLPPHKKDIKITSAKDRYHMVKLSIEDNHNFEVSDIEIKRKGISYSVETLRQLRKKYGALTELFFITGSDSLNEIDSWKDLKEVMKLCKLVFVRRPGFSIGNIPKPFIVIDINAKDISSRQIRSRIKEGKSIDNLVPKKVRDYIYLYNLYGHRIFIERD